MYKNESINKSLVVSIVIHILILVALIFSHDIKKLVKEAPELLKNKEQTLVTVSYLEASKSPLKINKSTNRVIIQKKGTTTKKTPSIPRSQLKETSKVKTLLSKLNDNIKDDSLVKKKSEPVKLVKNPNPPKEVVHTLSEKKETLTNTVSSAQSIDARQLEQMPGNPRPNYPRKNRIQQQQGTVVLKYLVTNDGTVNDIQIFQSSGFKNLDREAIKKIKQWKFKPGQAGETFHPIIFKLKGEGKTLPSRLRVKDSV